FLYKEIVKLAGIEEVIVPGVGLKEGLMIDMGQAVLGEQKSSNRDQVMTSAVEIGRKYSFDEQHGVSVARYALELFDQTKSLHNLALEHRLLLEAAAMLHDIGTYISMTAHHKHTYYLLTATPIIGLSTEQMQIVANVARYHRKSFPKMQHDHYRLLSSKNRIVVSKLAAILRLADAIDNEHASRVASFTVDYKKPNFTVHLQGEGDLLLEKWALMNKADLFEEIFGVKVSVED
ncbi:MAG: HD domain-containing protein, partial [Bacteroidetes bacterium]|nr:HD domain-containing protein [Bacteroidota bacterium]